MDVNKIKKNLKKVYEETGISKLELDNVPYVIYDALTDLNNLHANAVADFLDGNPVAVDLMIVILNVLSPEINKGKIEEIK